MGKGQAGLGSFALEIITLAVFPSTLRGFAWIFKKGSSGFVLWCNFFIGTGFFDYSQTGYLLAVATHFLVHRVTIMQPEGGR